MATTEESTTTRSGFPWADREFRFLARDDQFFAYGETPESAEADLRALRPQHPHDPAARFEVVDHRVLCCGPCGKMVDADTVLDEPQGYVCHDCSEFGHA